MGGTGLKAVVYSREFADRKINFSVACFSDYRPLFFFVQQPLGVSQSELRGIYNKYNKREKS